jgi:alpha-N-acetylglucosamine transferase
MHISRKRLHFKEVITMLPEMFDDCMFSNYEISVLMYDALHGDEDEE